MRGDSIVVCSGGLDSVTLLHYVVKKLKRTPLVLSFNYGQRHHKELLYAAHHAIELDLYHYTINLDFFHSLTAASALIKGSEHEVPDIVEVMGDPQPITYVPNRNAIMLMVAAGLAEAMQVDEVFIGVQLHDQYGYWDTTETFMKRVNFLLSLNRKNTVSFKAPFVNHSKAMEIREGLEMGVDYGLTWSCYKGNEKACGKCPTCAERLAAFQQVGIADPLPYE